MSMSQYGVYARRGAGRARILRQYQQQFPAATPASPRATAPSADTNKAQSLHAEQISQRDAAPETGGAS